MSDQSGSFTTGGRVGSVQESDISMIKDNTHVGLWYVKAKGRVYSSLEWSLFY